MAKSIGKSGGGSVTFDRAPTGWYLYADGTTRWGVGVWHGGKYFPKLITAEENEEPIEKKLEIWNAYVKEMDTKKKAIEEKTKEEEAK